MKEDVLPSAVAALHRVGVTHPALLSTWKSSASFAADQTVRAALRPEAVAFLSAHKGSHAQADVAAARLAALSALASTTPFPEGLKPAALHRLSGLAEISGPALCMKHLECVLAAVEDVIATPQLGDALGRAVGPVGRWLREVVLSRTLTITQNSFVSIYACVARALASTSILASEEWCIGWLSVLSGWGQYVFSTRGLADHRKFMTQLVDQHGVKVQQCEVTVAKAVAAHIQARLGLGILAPQNHHALV